MKTKKPAQIRGMAAVTLTNRLRSSLMNNAASERLQAFSRTMRRSRGRRSVTFCEFTRPTRRLGGVVAPSGFGERQPKLQSASSVCQFCNEDRRRRKMDDDSN